MDYREDILQHFKNTVCRYTYLANISFKVRCRFAMGMGALLAAIVISCGAKIQKGGFTNLP